MFLGILGPKVGYIDFSVISGFVALVFLASIMKIRLPYYGAVLIFLVALVLLYSMLVFVVNPADEWVVIRSLRATVNTMCLGAVIYNFPISTSRKVETIVIVLLINALMIVFQAVIPEIQTLFAELYGFNKPIRQWRAFGLTAGYDTAGYLSIMGLVLSFLLVMHSKNIKKSFLESCIFGISALFTSR